MQQKIVIKVPMKKHKDRSKAMKIAVRFIVKIGGEDKDFVVVIGDEVDAVGLVQLLIKKFGGGTLVKMEPLMLGRRFNHEHEEDDQALSMYQANSSFNNNNNEVAGFPHHPQYYYYNIPNYYPPPFNYYA